MGVVIRQSVKSAFVTYIGAAIGFFTTYYILPRFLGEELIGLTRVLLVVATLFATLCQLGTSQSAIRFYPYFSAEGKKQNGFFFYLMSVVTIGFLLFVPLFLLFNQPISDYYSKESALFVDYIYWLIPLTLFLLYWFTFEVYAKALMRIAVPKFIREVAIRVMLLGIYLAYHFGWINLDGLVACFCGVYMMAMLFSFVYVSRIGSVSLKHDSHIVTPALKKEFFSYTSVLLLGSLAGSLISIVDVLMITGEMGLAFTGIYTLAFYMASVIEMPSRSISAISEPIAAEALKQGDFGRASELYKKVSIHQLMIGSLVFMLIWFNIDNIYAIIPNGDVYRAGKWVVLFLGLTKLIEVTISFGNILIAFSRHYHWMLYFTLFVSLLAIGTNVYMIPRYGLTGAAIATAFSSLVSYGLQQWLVFVKIKANPFSRNTLKLLLIMALLFAINYLLPQLSNPWVDGIYRSLVAGSIWLLLSYYLNVSEEVNRIVNKYLKKQ